MKIFDYLLIGCFIILIIGMFFFVQNYKTEGFKCLNDPIGYAQETIKRINDMPVICSCVAFEPGRIINFCSDKCPN